MVLMASILLDEVVCGEPDIQDQPRPPPPTPPPSLQQLPCWMANTASVILAVFFVLVWPATKVAIETMTQTQFVGWVGVAGLLLLSLLLLW